MTRKKTRSREGWTRVRFGDVVTNVNDQPKRDSLPLATRYVAGEHVDENRLRIDRWGTLGDELVPPTFKRRFAPSDVLFHSRNLKKIAVPDFLGITGEKLFVLRSTSPHLLQDFLPYVLLSPAFTTYAEASWSGSVNKFLNWTPLAGYEFDLPPVEEQKVLFGRFKAQSDASRTVEDALRQLFVTRRSALMDAFRPDRGSADRYPSHWHIKRVAEAGDVQLGQKRQPSVHDGDNVRPYLRVANVFDGRIDFSDLMTMHFAERDLAKYELISGDILLNEGQSRELVGRSAIFEQGPKGICFQMTLLRFRCHGYLIPRFVHAFFQHCLYR